MRKITAVCFILFVISSANAEKNLSLTFAQAADLAVSSSADLRHARASLALSEGVWKWGIRAYLPKFSLSVSENDRLQEKGPDSFLKNYSINIDQFLWDGGRTAMSRKLEKTELQLSSSKVDRMAYEIAESAITAYRALLSSRAILEIKKRSLLVLKEQRHILNEEVQLGLALQLDLANADINLADANLGIYSLELDLREMEKQFIELLGLEFLPELSEKIDIYRSVTLPLSEAAANHAKKKNPDLTEARFLITKRQAEVKYQSNSWIPALRLTGNFGLSGQRYPLTRYNWSAGINIEFSGPWFQNRVTAQAGFEPPHDKTALVQNSFTPLPDPASAAGKKQAKLALTLEQENYENLYNRIGRMAASFVEKCALAEKKRQLALETITLGAEKCRIEETRLNLGQITRLKLMETLIEQTQREIAAVEAAVSLLEAHRQLEQLLDLKPGELETFPGTSKNLQRKN